MSMCVSLVILNWLMDFDETWYEHYAIQFYSHLHTFEYPTVRISNMMAVWTGNASATPRPIGF
jgi:hypothetical protein